MRDDRPERRVAKSVAAAALLAGLAAAFPARADTAPACDAPLDLIRLANPLPHFGKKLLLGEPVTIVAIGSSSTAGAGASSPKMNYPSQLTVELNQHFPKLSITPTIICALMKSKTGPTR